MPLNVDYLTSLDLPPARQAISDRDVMLYALSIGLGRDPLDRRELDFVYERNLEPFSTMALCIGDASGWLLDPATGIDQSLVVHGAQRLNTYRPLPIGGEVIWRDRIAGLFDKGDRGAIIVVERLVSDTKTGALLAAAESTIFARGSGNFGGASGPMREFVAVPERNADLVEKVSVRCDAALLYRLNQDRNPLHSDPDFAARAGFERPILHGLCTYAMVAAGIARAHDYRRIESIEARFTRPVLPGDEIRVEMWEESKDIAFRASVPARDQVVLDGGRLRFAASRN